MWIKGSEISGEKVIDCCNYLELHADGSKFPKDTINICYGLEMYIEDMNKESDIDKEIYDRFISTCVFCDGFVDVSTINGRTLKDNEFLIEEKIRQIEEKKRKEEEENSKKESSHESEKGNAFGSVSGLSSLVLSPFLLLAKVFHMI